jgi:hypothetical protein
LLNDFAANKSRTCWQQNRKYKRLFTSANVSEIQILRLEVAKVFLTAAHTTSPASTEIELDADPGRHL